jgi:hypothetical protein
MFIHPPVGQAKPYGASWGVRLQRKVEKRGSGFNRSDDDEPPFISRKDAPDKDGRGKKERKAGFKVDIALCSSLRLGDFA